MTRPILYIAGPYSAGNGRTVAENIAVARRYAVAAANAGWMPFTPHLNTAHFEDSCPNVSHQEWLAGDLRILKKLKPGCDAILLLPNWEQSEGTILEVGWAKHIGLTILGPFGMAEEIHAPRRWIL